ncbi:MAG: efflux RND transporter permease subunit [Acidobacteria bacterium]|nr:efflux RND transporter permease subunit [Acidobacteriota bacterium]
MNLPKLAVERPVTTTMILISVVVVGVIALMRLPLAFLPDVDAPFIGVQIGYPNSNPTQIEREIVKPVEEALATLSGVRKISSEATADQGSVFLEFAWGESLDILRMEVSEKIDQIEPTLPEGISEPLIFSFSTSDIPVVQARVSAEGIDLSESYELLETRLLNPLRRVPGVGRVDLDGVNPKEISIDLEMAAIRAYDIDVGELIAKLQGASSNLVLGEVRNGGERYTARVVGRFQSVEAFENLTINETGVRLGDIANVTYQEPPLLYGRNLNGKFAIGLTVFKESTANTVETAREVMRVIEEDIGSDPLLNGINVFVWEDQADEIVNGVTGLRTSGFVGGLLAVFVLYFFLRRFDSTLIVSLTIPFSIIAACGVLFFMGKTLNILSMMGLMLGVGMLVDNAVVVLESIDRTHRTVGNTKKAALIGANHVSVAVTSATLTSLIVFFPLIFGDGNELTIWLGEVGIAISLALICSLFSSLTLIPLMSAHFLKAKKAKPIPIIEKLEARYVRVLGWTLAHPWKSSFIIAGAFVAGILPFVFGLVEGGMFSATKNTRLYLQYEYSDFTYQSESAEAVAKVEEYLNAHRDEYYIDSIYSFYAENQAGTTLTLTREDLGDKEIGELRKKIREGLPEVPGARIFFYEDTESGGSSTYFSVKFFGQDTTLLERYAREAVRRLETVEGVNDISTSLDSARREIQVTIDRDKAAKLGLTAQDMSDIFGFTLGGMRLRRFNAGDREVETWLALRDEDRETMDDLRNLQLRTATGTELTLGDVADFQIVSSPDEIDRENRKVRVQLRAVYDGENWDATKEQITGLMDSFDLPPGYSWSYNDRIVEQESQDAQMLFNVLMALMLVYVVMAALFESYAQPFAILFSIPLALPGITWLLAATGTPFNMMAQIGILILMGIVVNNGIVLLDHLNHLRRSGLGREEAILQAGRDRLRPIMMTALTTITGLLPLAIGGAHVGGLMYFPMARTVLGGLISSTFLTLLVLPFINDRIEATAGWVKGVWSAARPREKTNAVDGDTEPATA